jgi:hypothetical protein
MNVKIQNPNVKNFYHLIFELWNLDFIFHLGFDI